MAVFWVVAPYSLVEIDLHCLLKELLSGVVCEPVCDSKLVAFLMLARHSEVTRNLSFIPWRTESRQARVKWPQVFCG
jgi:hypothetical protein